MENGRYKGYERGQRWCYESPDKYGIKKLNILLPHWLDNAVGYYLNLSFFAIFKEGDWFDGRKNGDGWAGVEFTANLFDSLRIPNKQSILFVRQEEGWEVHYSDANQICAWMELHAPSKEYQDDDIMSQPHKLKYEPVISEALLNNVQKELNNYLALRKRLIIWINAKMPKND